MARPTITNAEFNRHVPKIIAPALRSLGFEPERHGCFLRPHDRWSDVIFCDLNQASKDCFYTVIGVHIPLVTRAKRAVLGSDFPAAQISRALNFDSKKLGSQKWYFFGSNGPLEAALDEMLQDFRTVGVPWLEQFRSFQDVVETYYRERIREGERSSPAQWTTYGLLLQELGRREEATEWFERAKEELRKPIFSDGQRFYHERRPGTRQVPPLTSDRKLLELLESGALADP